MSAQLFVGIDVSNQTLDVTFLNQNERAVRPAARYDYDPQGWTELRTAIVAAASLARFAFKIGSINCDGIKTLSGIERPSCCPIWGNDSLCGFIDNYMPPLMRQLLKTLPTTRLTHPDCIA